MSISKNNTFFVIFPVQWYIRHVLMNDLFLRSAFILWLPYKSWWLVSAWALFGAKICRLSNQITLNYYILSAISIAEVFFVTFGHNIYTETVFQFCELVTKILTITSEGADDSEWVWVASCRGGKHDPPGCLLQYSVLKSCLSMEMSQLSESLQPNLGHGARIAERVQGGYILFGPCAWWGNRVMLTSLWYWIAFLTEISHLVLESEGIRLNTFGHLRDMH